MIDSTPSRDKVVDCIHSYWWYSAKRERKFKCTDRSLSSPTKQALAKFTASRLQNGLNVRAPRQNPKMQLQLPTKRITKATAPQGQLVGTDHQRSSRRTSGSSSHQTIYLNPESLQSHSHYNQGIESIYIHIFALASK